MKYWILSSEDMPPVGGGIGTYVAATARLFANNGHNVTVFIHDAGAGKAKISETNGIRYVHFSSESYPSDGLLGYHAQVSWAFAAVLESFMIREGLPDILESQEYQGIAYYTLQKKHLLYERFSDLPIVITCHAPAFVYLEYNHVSTYEFPTYWVCEMEKFVLTAADLIISPSEYIVNQIRLKAPELHIDAVMIPNPVEGVCNEKSISDFEKGQLICFGKLSPLKGTFRLIEYMKELWDDGLNYQITLVGGHQHMYIPEGCTAKEYIERKYGRYLEAGLIKLKGAMKQPDAISLIKKAQVVIVPSLVDNLPYTVLEAMLCKRVVLASKQGGQAEVIEHDRNGFLFDHHKKGEFAEKLLHILNLCEDKHLAIGEAACHTIQKKFDPSIIYESKMKAFHRISQKVEMEENFPFVRLHESYYKSNSFQLNSSELVSVVIPYYNLGKYIDATIASVRRSTYANVEIVIVNDGSDDRYSIEKLKELNGQQKVSVIHTKNHGLATARNTGAQHATGKYLFFLDADDLISPDFLRRGIDILQKYLNVHFVTSWLGYFGRAEGGWPCFNPEPPYLLVHNMVSCSILVLRESFLRFGRNDTNLIYGMEDWDMILSLVSSGCYGVVLPEKLISYRVRSNSMSRNFTKAKRLYSFRYISEKHKMELSKYSEHVAGLLHANGSGLDFDNPTMGHLDHYQIKIGPFSWQISSKIKNRIMASRTLSRAAFFMYQIVKRK